MCNTIDYIRLAMTPTIGGITLRKLLQKYKTPQNAIEYLEQNKNIVVPHASIVEKELENAKKLNIKIILETDKDFPPLLKLAYDRPALIYLRGNIETLKQNKNISIVGSRNASINGKTIAKTIANELTEMGYTIVSGMAIGIDSAAHIGALSSSSSSNKTIAVLAGGVDNIYPISNTKLYYQIIESGALISEMPISTEPQANLFPRRNRIISGLSLATLVVEANIKSGSLITARTALNQNREVLAIPNFPFNNSSGSNALIKNGAHLVENATDIDNIVSKINYNLIGQNFNYVKEDITKFTTYNPNEEADLHNKILSLLNTTPVSVDLLYRELVEYNIENISTTLLNLELDDKIFYPSAGTIALKV